MSLEPGQILDNKYRVVRVIGEGGMGAVFEGENVRIKRRVAIKTLHAAIANNAEVVMRFEREAQAAGRIGSDHILEVLDLGALPTGDRYIVMEFLDGEPLSKRIERLGHMSPGQLLPLMRQVLEGLGAAHAASIIHRDLKPDNIFILRQKAGRADYVKIIDFGISKFSSDQQSMGMTRTGTMMGTPLYMSPEQANGSSEADARSDIYAIGMIMYEALSGSTPFTAKSFNELLFQIVLLDIPTLDKLMPGFDPELAQIVAKSMARDKAQRFQSTAELAQALESWKARTGTRSEYPPGMPGNVTNTMAAARPSQVGTGSQPGVDTGSQPGVQNFASASQPGTPITSNTPYPAPVIAQTPWPAQQQPQQQQPASTGNTQGAWGNSSQPGLAPTPAPKSKAPLFAAIALGALVVLGGGGFAVSRVVGGGSAAKQPETKESAEPKTTVEAKKTETKKPEEDKKPEEAPAPTADTAKPAETAASASVAPKPDPKKPPVVVAPKGTTAPTAKATTAPTGAATGKKPADWGY
ncbi:MAG: protein kinase domain-containing protein [Polyangiales bacterium]